MVPVVSVIIHTHSMNVHPTVTDRLLAAYFRRGFRGFHWLRRWSVRFGGSPLIRVRSRFGALYEPYFGAGSVFWDIRSNLGLHAVAAKVVSPTTTVCAFEPVAELHDCIRNHAKLNGVELESHSIALAAATADSVLHVPPGGTSGRASLHPVCGIPDTVAVPVSCVRADDLIRAGRAPSPKAIKLDVEGAEPEVLDGFGDYLREPRLRAIAFEGNPNLEATGGADPVGSRLLQAGFSLRRLERLEPTHHLLENYLAYRP
jgi:FkbM family methyltransferase